MKKENWVWIQDLMLQNKGYWLEEESFKRQDISFEFGKAKFYPKER